MAPKRKGPRQSISSGARVALSFDWAGKAERLSFDVPALLLFIHERLSTKAIVETLTRHKRDKQATTFDLALW